MVRATARPSAVARLVSPDTIVANRTPVRSWSRMSVSNSIGRRVRRLLL
jgi:hypothetical protein